MTLVYLLPTSSIVGSYAGYKSVHNYESMIKIVQELSDEDKRHLVEKVQQLVGSSGIEALTTFIGQQVNREVFLNLVKNFTQKVTSGG